MALPQRKTAAAPVVDGVNFGALDFYTGAVFVPDGDYLLMFNVMMHQGKGVNSGPPRLGVMVDFYPLSDPREEAKIQQFYSMGSKASLSFAPNPLTGKGIVPIPNAQGSNLNHSTNWAVLLKSLYDSGLPSGIFSNDVSVLDGIWAHVTNIEEPEERAGFQNAMQDVQPGQPRQARKIAVVTEIKEGGCPWENGGGVPESATAVVAASKKPSAKVNGKPPVVVDVTSVDEELSGVASSATADVLMKKPNGCPLASLRMDVFKAVKSKHNEETAGKVIAGFFDDTGILSNMLGDLSYKVEGVNVKPLS